MITVPESVLTYFEQSAVETAVDLLLTGKEPKVPDNLRWDEVASFYRACLAARQVQAEFALLTEELWRAIWHAAPTDWKPRAPADPERPDLGVGISTIWDEGCFSRRFEQRNCSLELTAGLWSNSGVQIGVALWDKGDKILLDSSALLGWAQEGYDMFWTQDEIAPLAKTIDPASFERWTKQAWAAVATATATN